MNEEEKNQKYMELQFISQQLQNIQQQLQATQQQLIELASVNLVLGEVEKTKKESNILVSLGAGIFAHGKLLDNSKVIMNVGSKTAVEKNIPEVARIVKEQIEQLQKLNENTESNFVALHEKMQELQRDLMKAQEKAN